MELAKIVERSMKFLVKMYLFLVALCIALKLVGCWIASVHLSIVNEVELWGAMMGASLFAYLVWKYRQPKVVQKTGRHGAERIPLMPNSGGPA
jgi:FtsH-binding integral membrane protein